MSLRPAETRLLSAAFQALEPHLPRVLVVGGWAHRLLSTHPLAEPLPYELLATADLDIAAEASLPASGELDGQLRAAGFEPDYRGDDSPPVTEYLLHLPEGDFPLELLVPSRSARKSADVSTRTVLGAPAQVLPDLELLLIEPWSVEFKPRGKPTIVVRIPNPAAFVAHKLIRLRTRTLFAERAKDLVYVHDTLALFPPSREVRAVASAVTRKLTKGQKKTLANERSRNFASASDDVRRAVDVIRAQAKRTTPTPEQFALACRQRLAEWFG